MKYPTDLIGWAIGLGVAWVIFNSLTGVDDWLKKLVGKKDRTAELETKVVALEKRLADLEKK